MDNEQINISCRWEMNSYIPTHHADLYTIFCTILYIGIKLLVLWDREIWIWPNRGLINIVSSSRQVLFASLFSSYYQMSGKMENGHESFYSIVQHKQFITDS